MSRWTLAVLVILAATVAAGQGPIFSTRVEGVRVDVLVTEDGRPIRGLKAEDFEILDNGVRQQIDFVRSEAMPLDVVTVLDMSQSVAGERLDHLRNAGRALLGALTTQDRMALITFGHAVDIRTDLTADVSRARDALESAIPGGDTALIDASFAGLVLGEAPAGRPLLIVFSDGFDTSSFLTPEGVVETAGRSETVVYAVSVRGPWKPDFLRDLTERTGGRLFEVEQIGDLGATFLTVLEEFRQRYLLGYTPRGVARDGTHRLEVRLKDRKATVRARAGYIAGS